MDLHSRRLRRLRDGFPPRRRTGQGPRYAWRSPSAAARWPGWSATPIRAANTPPPVRPRVTPPGSPSRWGAPVGAGQRGRGIVQLHPGIRVAARQLVSRPAEARRAAVAAWSSTTTTLVRRHSTNGMLSPVDYEITRAINSSRPRRRWHEPAGRLRRRCPPRAVQATGPPLRPQGSLSRSLRDGLPARP